MSKNKHLNKPRVEDYIGIGPRGIMLHAVQGWEPGTGLVGYCPSSLLIHAYQRALFTADALDHVECGTCARGAEHRAMVAAARRKV